MKRPSFFAKTALVIIFAFMILSQSSHAMRQGRSKAVIEMKERFFHSSVKSGFTEAVRGLLLKPDFDMSRRYDYYHYGMYNNAFTAFHKTIENNNLEILNLLLPHADSQLINARIHIPEHLLNGMTPLHFFIYKMNGLNRASREETLRTMVQNEKVDIHALINNPDTVVDGMNAAHLALMMDSHYSDSPLVLINKDYVKPLMDSNYSDTPDPIIKTLIKSIERTELAKFLQARIDSPKSRLHSMTIAHLAALKGLVIESIPEAIMQNLVSSPIYNRKSIFHGLRPIDIAIINYTNIHLDGQKYVISWLAQEADLTTQVDNPDSKYHNMTALDIAENMLKNTSPDEGIEINNRSQIVNLLKEIIRDKEEEKAQRLSEFEAQRKILENEERQLGTGTTKIRIFPGMK